MNKYLSEKILLFCALLFTACKTETQEYISTFSQQLSDGKSIEVKRSDQFKQYYGIVTGIKWNDSHSFQYEFMLKPDDIQWKGMTDQVPQRLSFCGEELYLLVKGEKVIVDTAKIDSIPKVVKTHLYFKNVDKRYFFNWFGDQYFEEIDSLKFYESRKNCKEENIPVQ